MKGVVLAGGSGSRMAPMTEVTSKAMVTVYDRPAIEYPLRTLRNMGCEDAVIVASPTSIGQIAQYFKQGDRVGMDLEYRVQGEPKGVADALKRAQKSVQGVFPLLLGDVYFGERLRIQTQPTLFWKDYERANEHSVWNPETDSIVEKPRYIDLGRRAILAYYYDEQVFDFIDSMSPAQSGELEIVDIHNFYRQLGAQFIEYTGFFADMGTPGGLLRAANYEKEKRTCNVVHANQTN